MARLTKVLFVSTCIAVWAVAWVSTASAQAKDIDLGVEKELLQLDDRLQCRSVARALEGNSSGAQWLIGDGIGIYSLAGSRQPVISVDNAFAQVTCYSEVDGPGGRRVFVATEDLTSCGWVRRLDLLDEHRREELDAFQRIDRVICEAARPMPLGDFCKKLSKIFPDQQDVKCEGLPTGLRAKAALLGSDAKSRSSQATFRTQPDGGSALPSRTFFSILEIHDVAANENGDPVVLVGDGEGDMFGWVELKHLEIWPTRLGLFYDVEGKGYLFSKLQDLITNWRDGEPDPNIRPGLPPDELADYVHGNRQLLSYPIVRTSNQRTDIFADPHDTAYHEVIFLGRSTNSAAADLVSDTELAGRMDALQQLNVMLVVDTTESMLPYLPLLRQGISGFIRKYREDLQNPSLRLPDMRLAVYAYSDFQSSSATALDDPIDKKTLMPPRSVNEGVDLSGPLQAIADHDGIRDRAGLREEAAFEAVVQQARRFENDGGWFEDGPRFVIHLADHGSRSSLNMDVVQRELNKVRTRYIPLSIITGDETPAAKAAREAMAVQAQKTMETFLANPTQADVFKIDLLDFEQKTPKVVSDGLRFVMGAAARSAREVRATGAGSGAASDQSADAYELRDRAASQIELSQRLLEEFGLDDLSEEAVFQAAAIGFAPLVIREHGLERDLDWTYTVALDPEQASVLEFALSELCRVIGTPGDERKFISLIARLARAFSGDDVEDQSDLYAILADLGNLPGAEKSFMAVQPRVLRDRIDSDDPKVVAGLRRDVCWTSYHFTNMRNSLYVRPQQLLWTGREFNLKDGEKPTHRTYRYRPVIGTETVFVPGFFFMLPSKIEAEEGKGALDDFFNR